MTNPDRRARERSNRNRAVVILAPIHPRVPTNLATRIETPRRRGKAVFGWDLMKQATMNTEPQLLAALLRRRLLTFLRPTNPTKFRLDLGWHQPLHRKDLIMFLVPIRAQKLAQHIDLLLCPRRTTLLHVFLPARLAIARLG
jgi:hypothetical protein